MGSAAYPLFLDLQAVPVLVVGGGGVSVRKVAALVECGGRPTVVAPAVHRELEAQAAAGRIMLDRRPYRAGEAANFRLVFAATDDAAVNAGVAEDARSGGAWVNLADDPQGSTAVVPASVREGAVTAALSTGGGSPLLARLLRERVAEVITPGVGRVAARLGELRAEVRSRWPEDETRRRRFWFELVDESFLDSAIAGDDRDVEQRIARCLSQS